MVNLHAWLENSEAQVFLEDSVSNNDYDSSDRFFPVTTGEKCRGSDRNT